MGRNTGSKLHALFVVIFVPERSHRQLKESINDSARPIGSTPHWPQTAVIRAFRILLSATMVNAPCPHEFAKAALRLPKTCLAGMAVRI
jgi:hypothetical protein